MQTWRKAIFEDPALLAMGLVPAGKLPTAAFGNGVALSWRTAWAMFALGTAMLFAVFSPTVVHTVSTWYHSTTFNHGFLIFPICGYLLWIKRFRLAEMAPRPCWWGVSVELAAGAGWLVGHAANTVVVQQFALVAMIWGLMLTLLGVAVIREIAFAMFYMVFAVPFGDFLVPRLQDITAHFSVFFLRLAGIPTFLDGIFISIPTGNFEVAEACAGVRFLIATLALGFLFAHLTYTRWFRRIVFVLLCFVVPVIANGFRAFGIILIAYLSNNELAAGVDHIVYGWIFFAFVTLLLLSIGMTFRDPITIGHAIGDQNCEPPSAAPRQIMTATLAVLAAATLSPAYAAMIDSRPAAPIRVALVAPKVGGSWTELAVPDADWSPSFPGAAGHLRRSYWKDGREVDLYIALYTRQRQGAEMISGQSNVADGKVWTRAAIGTAVAKVDGQNLRVAVTRIVGGGRGRLVLDWYWIGGRYTSDPYLAKALQAYDKLFVGNRLSAAILVSSTYDERPATAMAFLKNFVADLPPLRPVFEQSTKGR